MKAVPNQYGVFDEEATPGVEVVKFDIGDGFTYVRAFVLEAGPQQWVYGYDYRLRECGASSPLLSVAEASARGRRVCTSRDDAIAAALRHVTTRCRQYLDYPGYSQPVVETSRKYLELMASYQSQGRLF